MQTGNRQRAVLSVQRNDFFWIDKTPLKGRRKRRDAEDIVTISASQPVRRFEPEHVIIENSATYQSKNFCQA